jgi:aryl-alcohol dehydrogenase-like predicted oxidoreductase
MEQFFKQALKKLKIDRADILLLGWHNQPPSNRILDRALALRDKGMFRFLAVSGHQRPMFAQLADDLRFELFHVRYNAAHRGAQSRQNAGRRKTAQRNRLLPFCHVTSSRIFLYVRTQEHRRDA